MSKYILEFLFILFLSSYNLLHSVRSFRTASNRVSRQIEKIELRESGEQAQTSLKDFLKKINKGNRVRNNRPPAD